MNPDPLIPLVKREDDPFERALLRAGQRERAPHGTDRRLLAALGVGGGGALSALLARYGSKLVGVKTSAPLLLAAVALSVAAVAAGTWAVSRDEHPIAVPATAAPPPPSTAPTAPSVAPAPAKLDAPVEALPSTRVEDLPSSPVSAKAQTKPPASAAASSSSSDTTGDLAREVALVQEARAALTRGDSSEALRVLDVHDREFPTGTLSPESRVLRIEALVRAGGAANTARANALGDAFLGEHPSGPQARRVRAVLGRDR